MVKLIPKGVEIAPNYMKNEVELQVWLNDDGSINKKAPSSFKQMHKDLLEEIQDVKNEERVIY